MSDKNQLSNEVKDSDKSSNEIKPKIESAERKVRLCDSIGGQLALLIAKNSSEMIAIPIDIYNRNGSITLGIERPPNPRYWGTKYGHWAQTSTPESSALPLGLSVLIPLDKLFISETQRDLSSISGHRNKHRLYYIRNGLGDLVFVCKEKINYRVRHVFGVNLQIDLKVYDPFKREVLFLRKLLRFDNCLFSCYLQRMQVMAQPSKVIGTVRQKGRQYWVCDEKAKPLFKLKTKKSGICGRSLVFSIESIDSKTVGEIKPSLNEDITVDNKEMPVLSLTFPSGLSPTDKSRLFAATFLIKYLFYDLN